MTDLSIARFLATTTAYFRSLAAVAPARLPNQGKRDGYRPLKTRRAISRQPGAFSSTRRKPGVLGTTVTVGDGLDASRTGRVLAGSRAPGSFGSRSGQLLHQEPDWTRQGEIDAPQEGKHSARIPEDLCS
jgi:hypothetical protein